MKPHKQVLILLASWCSAASAARSGSRNRWARIRRTSPASKVANRCRAPDCFPGSPTRSEWEWTHFWHQVEKRPGGGEAWGSLVHGDDRIYLTDRKGTTVVFAAGPTYKHLATNPLGEHTDASIAISGGNLFIRTHKHLWCIGEMK